MKRSLAFLIRNGILDLAMKAYWTGQGPTTVSSTDELLGVVAEVKKRGQPTMLFLEHDDGRTLVVGFGAPESVLTFVDVDGTSFHSVGDPSRSGVIRFWCRDQVDDFLAELAVPVSMATDAAFAFAAKGTIPQNVTWEADW